MTTTFTVGLKGKAEKAYGPGMKIVEGEITGGSGQGTFVVNAKDVGLSRIYSAFANGPVNRTYSCHVGSAGELDNYVQVATDGSAVAVGTFRMLAIGE